MTEKNEGELKQRIRQLKGWAFEYDATTDSYSGCRKYDIYPILVEAAKDWLDNAENGDAETTGEYIDGFRRWFKKWFGTLENKENVSSGRHES